jgi:UDP-N-acetylmuramyl pentapeptide phosphotransferase/UDP-N-acetylglucosamine-1-phosphate transferase
VWNGLARWPLLFGSVILFVFALWEESHNTAGHTTVAIVSLALGAVLLGGWFYSIVVDAERKGKDDGG